MSRIYRCLAALRRLKSVHAPVRAARTPRARLWLSPLEDRTVPTAYMVNALTDTGGATGTGTGTTGDLRYCIVQANTNSGADTISFQTGLTGTITLNGTELLISDSLAITGPGSFRPDRQREQRQPGV